MNFHGHDDYDDRDHHDDLRTMFFGHDDHDDSDYQQNHVALLFMMIGIMLMMSMMMMVMVMMIIKVECSGVLGVAVHTLLEGSGEYSYVASSFETDRSYSFLKVMISIMEIMILVIVMTMKMIMNTMSII